MFCMYCGTQLPDEANFCVSCGRSQDRSGGQGMVRCNTNQEIVSPKRKVLTATGMVVEQEQYIDENGYIQVRSLIPGLQEKLSQEDGIIHRNNNIKRKRPEGDRNFTKFLEVPLPFQGLKILSAVILVMLSALSAYHAISAGALTTLTTAGAVGSEVVELVIPVLWCVAAAIGAFVKFNKPATAVAGVFLMLAAGLSITTAADIRLAPLYAIISGIFAVVYMISAAGGIQVDLDR